MTCNDWLDALLEAEPEELRGEGDSALSRHLGSCPECRAKAELLVRAMGELDQDLAAEAGRAPLPGRRGPGRLRRAALVALPLAAAAVVALVLLSPFGPGRNTPLLSPSLAAPVADAVPVVTPPAGRDAAVIQTDNPDIVIVWLY